MRRPLHLAFLLVMALGAAGCGLFGLGSDSDEAQLASIFGDCLLFSGDCCPTRDGNGFIECGDLFEAPAETIHTTSRLGRERLDTVVEDEVCIPSLELTTP